MPKSLADVECKRGVIGQFNHGQRKLIVVLILLNLIATI